MFLRLPFGSPRSGILERRCSCVMIDKVMDAVICNAHFPSRWKRILLIHSKYMFINKQVNLKREKETCVLFLALKTI